MSLEYKVDCAITRSAWRTKTVHKSTLTDFCIGCSHEELKMGLYVLWHESIKCKNGSKIGIYTKNEVGKCYARRNPVAIMAAGDGQWRMSWMSNVVDQSQCWHGKANVSWWCGGRQCTRTNVVWQMDETWHDLRRLGHMRSLRCDRARGVKNVKNINDFISIVLLNTMIRSCLNRYKRLD